MVDSTNPTIGQLFELNQGKNATQIADTEARARQAAKTLGLDYNKMVQPPEQVISVADELTQEQRFNHYIDNDPVIRDFTSDASNAAISLDDLGNLSDISKGVSALTPKFGNQSEITDAELKDIFSKNTNTKSKEYFKKIGIDVDPPKQIKPSVPSALTQMLNAQGVPLTFDQQVNQREQEIFQEHGAYAAAQYRKFVNDQVAWDNYLGNAELRQSDPNKNEHTFTDSVKSGYASIWQTVGAAQYALGGGVETLQRFTQYKQRLGQSNEMQTALSMAGMAAENNQYGVLGAAEEFIRQGIQNPSIFTEFAAEQLPPALIGFGVGSAAARAVTTPIIRNATKVAPYFVSMEKAAKVGRVAGFAGSMVEGAVGAGVADAAVSYGANMAEAQEKFLTRAEQIDYANAKTWGSAFYSGLGGALLPFRFGGPMRTVGGQAVIQSIAGMASVYGGADAVGEQADPVEVALEGIFGGVFAIPEVAIVAAGKVKNQNTALAALEQVRQDQAQDSMRALGFGNLLGGLVDRLKQSKTNERDPEVARDFIQRAVQEHGATNEVYIDGQTFNQLLRDNDIDVDDLFSRAPSLQDQLGNAEEFGGSISIPVDEFASAMATLDDPLPFIENVRSSPDMPTIRETEDNLSRTTEQMRREIDIFLGEQAKFESAEESRDFVYNTVLDQLKQIKRKGFSSDYNRSATELTTAFYVTLGEKLGVSAKEAFERYPINVVGEMEGEASYEQQAWHGTPYKGIEKTGFKLENIGTGEGAQAYGFGIYFAENRPVAESYRSVLSGREAWRKFKNELPDNVDASNLLAMAKNGELHASIANIIIEVDNNGWLGFDSLLKGTRAALSDINAYGDISPELHKAVEEYQGQLYSAEIPDNHELLDWDKIIKDQPKNIINALFPAANSPFRWTHTELSNVTGKGLYHALVKMLGTPEKASEHLRNIGIPGLRYLDGNSRSEGEGTYNYVIWDESRLNNDIQTYYAGSDTTNSYNQSNSINQQGNARGSITFRQDKDGSTIVLSRNADFSTFAHELGHHFLEMNMQIALSPDAPVEIKRDMETVLKWADPKITDLDEWFFLTDAEKTEIHEKFAESFEQYVFTGKSPSVALKQVFQRFRQFMIAVYRNIEKFMGINSRAELNPDLTGVMDRMLASDVAIKEAQAASSLEMLITQDDAMRMGISPKDYDEMRQDHEDATEFATNNLEQRAIRDLSWYQRQRSKYIKTLQREADRKRAALREDIAKEVAEDPIYKAMAFLRQPLNQTKKNNQKLDSSTDTLFEAIAKLGGLDAAEIESTWGVDQAAKIKSGVGNTPLARSERSKVKGLSIEHMAERLAEEGYLSVDEHGKFDTHEFESKFSDELMGIKQYSNHADMELIFYAEEMDLLQMIEQEQITKAKLSLDWIESKYGKNSEIFKNISKGAYGLAQRGGESPDLVAEAFGFESGDALIRELLSAPSPKQRIDELTDVRMAAEYAEFYDQQSIVEAVESALHNDIRARLISTEMAALNNLMGRKSALNEAAKSVAQDMINRQRLKDIRPHLRAKDDARLGREADAAFRKGDLIAAARNKRNQLVQFYATKYSYDAKTLIDKKMQLVKKIFGNNEKLAKGRDFDLVTAARAVLAKYSLGRESSKYDQQLDVIRREDPTTYADLQNIGILPDDMDYRELTLDEFNAVMSVVETLWHRSKENKLWYTTNESLDREQVRNELIEQSGGKKSVPKIEEKLLGRQGAMSRLKTWGMEFGAAMKRVDQVVTWLDNGHSGKFRQYIVNPIQDALAQYRIAKTKMLEDVVNTFNEFGKLDNSKIDAPELNGYTFDGKQALIHAILHTGNMSNKERLVLGYGWGKRLEDNSVDFSTWDMFYRRMVVEGVITKQDMDTVQKLWDIFDSYKSDVQRTHKKINGYYFDELPALTLVTPFGDYKGGYVPVIYDRVRSNEQDRIQDKGAAEIVALDIATTGASFTKSRADRYHDQLELDISRLPSALDKELRYIHLELPVRQVGRMLLNKDFRNEIERVLPFGIKNIFNPWLKAVVSQTIDEASNSQLFDMVMKNLRRNTGIAIMAGNIKNAVEQLTGFSQILVAVPAKHLVKAQADFAISVATRSKMAESIMDQSDFMRTRWDRAADEYRYAIDDVIINKNKFQSVRDFTMRHAYILQTTIQHPMEVISWQAAFNNFTEQGMSQYDAVRAADSVIREYMNDMSPEGVSALERGSPAKRIFLMFYNWFNMVWNTANTEVKLALEANNGSWVKASPRLAYIALMMMSIPAIVSQLLFIGFAGGVKDADNDDNKWDDLGGQLALSQVKMLAAFVPYAGNVINAGISQTDDNVMNDRYTASPVFSVGEGGLALIQHANRALDEDKEVNQGRVARDMLNTATLATGIPFAVLGKPSNYWLQIEQGKKEDPESTVDAIRGTITGKHAQAD